jgi:hypothetical protein
MASSGKKKTTMAKLTRERRLRERRMDKQAKKDARKRAAAEYPNGQPGEILTYDEFGYPVEPAEQDEPAADAVAPSTVEP